MEARGPKACSMSVLLVTELVDESLEDHLPINSLRNYAVLLAQTPLIAMLDADMVVSASLADSLAGPDDAEVRKRGICKLIMQPQQKHCFGWAA